MDERTFDELTRALSRARTRRGLLRAAAGGVAAGLAGLVGRDAAAQRPTRHPNGAACSRATDCASYRCVDGVCCDTACTGQCESCASGICTPVAGPPVGNRPACLGSGPCQATCDGVIRTSCAGAPGPDKSCGDPTCANGWLTTYACGGNGACHPTTTSCGQFGCDASGTACATGCGRDDQCDDGDACTIDRCGADGACVHTPLLCESGDACTVATCDPIFGCGTAPLPPDACDDGDACTVDSCDPALGCVHTAVVCDDGDPCTVETCDSVLGCVSTVLPDSDACIGQDGVCCGGTCQSCCTAAECSQPADPCQIATCDGGVCDAAPQPADACDDGDACTVDSCDPEIGCVHTAIVCDDGDACTINDCDSTTGCVFTPVADGLPGACADGEICCGEVCKRDGGQDCTADGDCCSGACVLGVCAAACRGENGVCDSDADCCDGAICVPTGDVGGICCGSGNACGTTCCSTASLVCDAELICCEPDDRETTCAGRCGALSDNCDQAVDCGFDCVGADPACCDTFCADLDTSLFHCGDCGNDCTGQGLGSAACCDGTCRDLLSDVDHCGACDAPACTGSVPACCGGACHDLDDDPLHCGVCFRHCEPSLIEHSTAVACADARCFATACEAGYSVVAGACCADDRACGAGPNRTCCGTGETCCGGECVDTQVDPRHCTGCGIACPDGATCAGGECSQGAFGERCNVPNCVEVAPGVLDCRTTLQCVATYLCEGVPSITNPPKDACLDGRCCIPPGVSCTAPGGQFTWSGVCCCDPSKSCPSAGTC